MLTSPYYAVFMHAQNFCYGHYILVFLEDHSINWNNLRMMIGFNSKCVIGLDSVVPTFNKNAFPLKISRQTDSTLPRTNDIHNPTLRGSCIIDCNDFVFLELI